MGVKHHRRVVWLPSWSALVDAFDGPAALARELGVHYQTLWRWGVRGDALPPAMQRLVRTVAAARGVPSPV